jgi:tetratricopeptide (TPR) repeat protein
MKYVLLLFLFCLNISKTSGADFVSKAEEFMQISNYDSADYYYNLALNNCANSYHDTILAKIYVGKAIALKLGYKFDLAVKDYDLALSLYEKHNNINGKVYTLINLVEFYRSLHNFEKSIFHIERIKIILATKEVSKTNQAYFYNRYDAVLNETTTDRTETIKYSKKAIKLIQETGDKDLQASSLNELGFSFFLGLIINELITNSLKHAFNLNQSSLITVNLGCKSNLNYNEHFNSRR